MTNRVVNFTCSLHLVVEMLALQLKFKYLVVRRPLVQVLKCNASRLNRLGGGKEAAGESCCHRVSVVGLSPEHFSCNNAGHRGGQPDHLVHVREFYMRIAVSGSGQRLRRGGHPGVLS